jgi:serine/threonine-protein kinase RsbW
MTRAEDVMAPDSPRVTLTLPTDLRMLSVARAFVEAVCQAHGLDKSSTHAFILATAEAVSNIIRHAHRYRPEAQFQIECRFSSDAFEVAFLDEGDPFDLSAVPQLDPTELRVGGRGVYLMRALMDELTCQPRGERGNTLRMVKRPKAAAAVRECG